MADPQSKHILIVEDSVDLQGLMSQPRLQVEGVVNFIRKPIADIERLLETVEKISVPL